MVKWWVILQPQDSFPDVFFWMLVGGKKTAYYRLSAREIIHSNVEGQNGRLCGKPVSLLLRVRYPAMLRIAQCQYSCYLHANAFIPWLENLPMHVSLVIHRCFANLVSWFGSEKLEASWNVSTGSTERGRIAPCFYLIEINFYDALSIRNYFAYFCVYISTTNKTNQVITYHIDIILHRMDCLISSSLVATRQESRRVWWMGSAS